MVQRNTPVGRARHGKRLPQVLDDSGNIPSPITLTVTTVRQPVTSNPVITPTVTVFVPPAGTVSSPSSISSSVPTFSPSVPAPIPSTSPGTSVTTVIPVPTPSVLLNDDNRAKTNTAASGAASSQGIPTGSIVGIVLAIVLLVIAGTVFWFRRRAVADRLKMRGWASKEKNTPSFLWIDPKEAKGATPYPNMSSTAPYRGETSPEAMYSGGPIQPLRYGATNNGLAFIPPPAPPRPPPAAGMYEYPASPSASLAHGVPSTLTAGRESSSQPPPNTPTPAQLPAVISSAKVKSTFIPTLPDELSISTSEVVRIHADYDDGWALCSNARNEVGMVPLECLDRGSVASDSLREYKKLARVSSLAASPYAGYQ
ncbi:hypothetical protein FPV67DRAFT_1462611 [Lyophyllum atratum]|nr:hypothetical protein FPV67DRAFT_1462611 [Lyophyllum atratum]